jgi:hypothetical protein
MKNIECHLCVHSQGYYGNLFVWFFNLHNNFLPAPLRPRLTVKSNADDQADYSQENFAKGYFHFRPDDYHKWFVEDKTWEQFLESIDKRQKEHDWLPEHNFNKIVLKTHIHAPHKLYKLDLYKKINPTVIYNLTVDRNNTQFFEKLVDRLKLLNTHNDHVSVSFLLEQHDIASEAIDNLRKDYTVCDVDVDSLLFKYNTQQYNNVLRYLNSDPIDNWSYKLKYAKELIGE